MTRLLYDAAGAAELLSTSKSRIHELRRAGVIVAVKDGHEFKFTADDLHAYVESLPSYEPGHTS